MLVTERSCDLKGSLDAKFTLQLFEHKCVLEVCVHIHPLKSGRSESSVRKTKFCTESLSR